ncbi:MAG: ATP-binding cassette family protein, partial [Crocosphaera sp.]
AGADYVRVDFEFICYEQIYRIIRSRQRGKSNSLDFQINSSGEFLSLSGKGIKPTQKSIISTLKLDYDTFINSAYLRQGRADEFMLRRATERKKVLADLLKLDHYENLALQAKDLSKQYKGQGEQIKLNLERIKQRLTEEKEIKAQEKTINKDIEILQVLQQEGSQKLQTIKQEENHRQTWLEQLNWHKNKQQTLQQESTKIKIEKLEYNQKINEFQELIAQEKEINEKYEELLILQQQEENLSHQFQTFQEFQQRKQLLEQEFLKNNNKLQLQIHQQKTRLEQLEEQGKEVQKVLNGSEEIKASLQKLSHHRQRLKELDNLQHKVTPLLRQKQGLETELAKIKANLQAKLEQFNTLEKQYYQELDKIPERRQNLLDIDHKIHEFENKKVYQKRVKEKEQERQVIQEKLVINQRNYEEKIDELQQKLNLLNTPDSNCPLCEQELDEHHRHNVIEKTEKQQQEIQEQIWFLQEEMSVIKRDIKSLKIEKQQLEQNLQGYSLIQQEFYQVEAQLDQAGEVKIKLSNLIKEKEKIDNLIKTKSYGLEVQSELKTIDKTLQKLNYDEQNHALARGEVERWRWAEIKQAKIDDAIHNHQKISQQKSQLIKQISKLEAEQKELENNSNLKQEINQIEQELKVLDYDREYHQRISNYIRKSQSCVIKYQKLQEVKQQYPQLQEQFKILEFRLQTNQEEQNKTQQFIHQLSTQLETIKDHSQEIKILETTLQTQRQKLDELLAQKGRIEQSLSQLETLKQEKQEQQQQFDKVRKQYRVYSELTKAFSKNGIQLLMIENVLPQLEAETNHILSRLTGNQFHIQFVTQRAGRGSSSRKKSAKLIDTLDIIIADSRGTRAYET